jgi:membrane protease YdiL (CAAX protease family)
MQFSNAILTLVAAGVIAGAFVAWIVLGVRLSNRQPLLPYEPRQPVPWGGWDLLAAIAIYFIAQLICLTISMQLFGVERPKDPDHLSSEYQLALFSGMLAASAITFLGCIAMLKTRAGATLADFGIVPNRVLGDLKLGLTAFFAAVPFVLGIQVLLSNFITYEHPLIDAIKEKPSPALVWVTNLAAVVAAPILEEFLFRMLLQGWLEKLQSRIALRRKITEELPTFGTPEGILTELPSEDSFSNEESVRETVSSSQAAGSFISVPILLSSALFALVHFGQGAAHIPLFFLALVLGYLYQQTHRLLPCITVHFLLNGISMLVFLLSPPGNPPG